jgi:hypothetical protein
LLAGDDLDDVATCERVVERRDAAVDPGSAATLAQAAVDMEREVQWGAAFRQVDHLALRRHGVDAIFEQADADARQLVGIDPAALQQLSYGQDLLVIAPVGTAAFLVAPVRGDTQLGLVLHLLRANLHFQRAPVGSIHSRVDGLVVVALGRGDVIVELARQEPPQVVHDAQRRVAVGHGGHDDAHRPDVEHLIERQLLALHLPEDAVGVLRPSLHGGFDARLAQAPGQRISTSRMYCSRSRRFSFSAWAMRWYSAGCSSRKARSSSSHFSDQMPGGLPAAQYSSWISSAIWPRRCAPSSRA